MPLRPQDGTGPMDQTWPGVHLFINKVLFAHSPLCSFSVNEHSFKVNSLRAHSDQL